MESARVVPRDEWLAARKELLAKEKAATLARDALNAELRGLPMVRIEKEYILEGPDGKAGLPDLFEGRRQLIVRHFMFDPSWDKGCPSCSFAVDHAGELAHLHARDTTYAVVSRAPLAKIEPFKARMGWTFPWYSSYGSDFNYDFHVTLDPAVAPLEYNFRPCDHTAGEYPGVSVFLREDDQVFHTYSTYGRGDELLDTTYVHLDMTPLGRHEEGLEYPLAWVRHHDKYDT